MAALATAKDCFLRRRHFSPALKASLQRLENKLDVAIKQVGVAFVKLEQHSPIDVAAEATFAPSNQAFRQKLASMRCRDAENILWAWRESIMEGLAVRSGLEALRLLISSMRTLVRSASCRVFVRKFVDHQVHMRFRCFVSEQQVTGITQMSPYYHSGIEPSRAIICDKLLVSLATVVRRLPIPSFVVDLNFTKVGEVAISDLHPFDHMVHPGCFRWKDDRGVLESGPLEIRFRSKPTHDPHADMPLAWLDIVSEHFGEGHVASRTISRLTWRILALSALGSAILLTILKAPISQRINLENLVR
eukprot:TRINITY_DN1041_c0_g1_i6.p1 TRINITY_DN1041_c0_g1~~TRINITY_DN1041_c0_g1_i6.p1  ORF type:complete len:353 (-),score=4.23 TRINITY_DN1041_c0_g1_i6:250-1161(-)